MSGRPIRLVFTLRPASRPLFGEVAEQRFQSLAKTLGVTTVLRVGRAQSSKGSVAADEPASG